VILNRDYRYEQATAKAMDFAESCIEHNYDPEKAVAMLREAWQYALDDKKKSADYSFKRIEKGKS
jgi:hypothetical protein